MLSAFDRRVVWTQLSGRNTRYTIYQPVAATDGFIGRHITILVVPGNPGNDRIYDTFCAALAERLSLLAGYHTTICSVSHANHVLIDDDDRANYMIANGFQYSDFIEANAIRYNLAEQIEHKVEFCREIFAQYAKNSESVFIGHSIGAYIAIKILEQLRNADSSWHNVSAVYSLFPAVERMLETPEGGRVAGTLRFLQKFDVLTCLLTYAVCELMPRSIRRWISERYVGFFDLIEERNLAKAISHLPPTDQEEGAHSGNRSAKRAPHSALVSATEICRMNVIRNVIHMATHEFEVVKEFDNAILEEAAEAGCAMRFLYAIGDGWGPAEFGCEMRDRIAALGGRSAALHTVDVDETSRFAHAFVMHDSVEVADYLCDRMGLL